MQALWQLLILIAGINTMTVPFVYKAEIYDRQDNLCMVLRDITDCSWQVVRQGGCGGASLTVKAPFGTLDFVTHSHKVKLYINSEASNTWTHVYTGTIDDKQPVWGPVQYYRLNCAGYSSKLNNVMLGYKYDIEYASGTHWHDMIIDLITNHLTAKTGISESTTYIDTSSTDANSSPYRVKGYAKDIFAELCSLAGNFEFGVDKDGVFYFQPAGTNQNTAVVGKDLQTIEITERSGTIKNRVLVENEIGGATGYEAEADKKYSYYHQTQDEVLYIATGNPGTSALSQSFPKKNNSISSVKVYARLAGSDSGTLIADGNMEASSTTAWTADDGVTLSKGTGFNYSGTRSMICQTQGGKKGFSQDLATAAEGSYHIQFYAWASRGKFRCEVLANGSVYNVLASTEEIGYEKNDIGYQKYNLSFTAPAGLTSIKLRFVSTSVWVAYFRIDDVLVYRGAIGLKVALYDADDMARGNLLPLVVGSQYPYAVDVPSGVMALYDIPLNYYGQDDGVDNYLLFFYTDSYPGSAAFCLALGVHDGGEIEGGELKTYDEAADWDEVDHDAALCFDLIYNESINIYGPHEEIQAPTAQYGDIQTWVNYYLAGKSRAYRTVMATLVGLRGILNGSIPAAGIGDLVVMGLQSGGATFDYPTVATLATETIDATTPNIAMPFTPDTDISVSSIKVRVRRSSGATGYLWARFHNDDSGLPGEDINIIESTNYRKSIVNLNDAALGDVTFDISTDQAELKGGRQYWLCLDVRGISGSVSVEIDSAGMTGICTSDVLAPWIVDQWEPAAGSMYFELGYRQTYLTLPIEEINYSITENGITAKIQSGPRLPDMAYKLKQLEHKINSRLGW